MAAKRRWDWTQVAALAVVLAAVVVCILYADPDKAQAWLAVGPGILGFLAALWSASRGRLTEAPPPPARPRREADVRDAGGYSPPRPDAVPDLPKRRETETPPQGDA